MLGGRSLQLARIFGIRIGVNPSWFFVLFLIIWSLSGTYDDAFPGQDTKAFLLATASALLLFGSVLLHELGHGVVAMRNKIQIAGIDLWLFGGIAKMTRDPETPGVEFRVAAAGPLVTFVIAAVCWAGGMLAWGASEFWHASVLDERAGYSALEVVVGYIASINSALLLFNLIPGFPLDGGRIARAIAWWRTGDRTRATRFAAGLGRVFAYLIIGAGIYLLVRGELIGGIWFVLIGNFLAQAARGSELQSQLTQRLEGLRVADVMDDDPVALEADTKLDQAFDEFFLRYRWPWFPVIDRAGRFLGLVLRERVDEVPEELRGGWTVDEVMNRDAGGSLRVRVDEPLEALLGSEGLRTLGAIMAVDREGVLRGVVTMDRVRRALRLAGSA